MKKLLVQQNQISYAALFSKPAFPFWRNGEKILDGLFKTFKSRNISLGNFRVEQTSADLTTHSVTVAFSPTCFYQVKLDRIESVLNNFRKEDLAIFPEILQQGSDWLRSEVRDFSFQSHLFTYFGHNRLSEGTSQEVLATLPSASIPQIGISEGNGTIFHWKIPDRNWKVQLLLDHSLTFLQGLFVQFLLFTNEDLIDYAATAASGRSIMDTVLRQIGLEIDDAN